jgi:hypothetical protein
MTARLQGVVLLAVLATGCKGGERPAAFVIPGPTVPSPVPTAPPYVWDTRDELAIWVTNPVSRGSLVLAGSGAEAFVRIERAEIEWVLRGPDLTPRATGVRTARIRYRWKPDVDLTPAAGIDTRATAYFQTPAPLQPHYYGQGAATAVLTPRNEWTDFTFVPGQFTPPIDVDYCYLYGLGVTRGVLDIDRIELVR